MDTAQCTALETSKGALLAWTEVENVIGTQVPVQQSVRATEMGVSEATPASAVPPQN